MPPVTSTDLLAQANLSWTPGRLVLLSVVCWLVPAWLVYLKTGAAIASLIFGLVCGTAPLGYVRFKRGKRFDDFDYGYAPPRRVYLCRGADRVWDPYWRRYVLVERTYRC